MNIRLPGYFLLASVFFLTSNVQAEDGSVRHGERVGHAKVDESKGTPTSATIMREELDGTLEKGEYVVVDLKGSMWRALCPFTCEMRGLPEEHCKTRPSKSKPELCYVQDTRIPSDAVH